MVFHKTEPRVIGILDWEMATIGHPLSDFVNLVGPYTWSMGNSELQGGSGSTRSRPEFKPGATPGLPTIEQVVQWYREESGYDVQQDLLWGSAFGGFRGAVIMQGIAARYANRQASSVSIWTRQALMTNLLRTKALLTAAGFCHGIWKANEAVRSMGVVLCEGSQRQHDWSLKTLVVSKKAM